MKLSVVIPAHNEVKSVGETVITTLSALKRGAVDHEVPVIDGIQPPLSNRFNSTVELPLNVLVRRSDVPRDWTAEPDSVAVPTTKS